MEKKNFPRPKFFHTLLRSAEIKKGKKIYKKKTKKKEFFRISRVLREGRMIVTRYGFVIRTNRTFVCLEICKPRSAE